MKEALCNWTKSFPSLASISVMIFRTFFVLFNHLANLYLLKNQANILLTIIVLELIFLFFNFDKASINFTHFSNLFPHWFPFLLDSLQLGYDFSTIDAQDYRPHLHVNFCSHLFCWHLIKLNQVLPFPWVSNAPLPTNCPHSSVPQLAVISQTTPPTYPQWC
jgi:hypothetical protein